MPANTIPHTNKAAQPNEPSAPPITPLLLTIGQAAQLMNYSRAHLYRLLDSGALRSFGSGRARRILRADIEAWIAAQFVDDSALDHNGGDAA